jgi:hypothetical protein
MAVCEPQLVEIWQQDQIKRDLDGVEIGFLRSFAYFSAAPRDPDILRVSKESREAASHYLRRKDPNSEAMGFSEYGIDIPKPLIEVRANSLTDIFCIRGTSFNKTESLELFRHFGNRGLSTIAIDVNGFAPLRYSIFDEPRGKPSTRVRESWRMAQLDVVILYCHKGGVNARSPNLGSVLPVCAFKFCVATREMLENDYNDLLQQEKYLQYLFDDIETKVTAERTACEARGEEYRLLSVHCGDPLPGVFKKPKIELKGLFRKSAEGWREAFSTYEEYVRVMRERDRAPTLPRIGELLEDEVVEGSFTAILRRHMQEPNERLSVGFLMNG